MISHPGFTFTWGSHYAQSWSPEEYFASLVPPRHFLDSVGTFGRRREFPAYLGALCGYCSGQGREVGTRTSSGERLQDLRGR